MCEKVTIKHSKFLLYYHMIYCFIRGGIKLQIKDDTVQIWFMYSCMVRGISVRICRKYLIRWIALSTWVRTAYDFPLLLSRKADLSLLSRKTCWEEHLNAHKLFFYCKSSTCHKVIILFPEFFVQNATFFNNFYARCRAIIKLTNKCYCPRWGNSYKTFISDIVPVMREQATSNG